MTSLGATQDIELSTIMLTEGYPVLKNAVSAPEVANRKIHVMTENRQGEERVRFSQTELETRRPIIESRS